MTKYSEVQIHGHSALWISLLQYIEVYSVVWNFVISMSERKFIENLLHSEHAHVYGVTCNWTCFV